MNENGKQNDGVQKASLRSKIIGLSDWWALYEATESSATAHVLDLRSSDEQRQRFLCPPSQRESPIVVPIPVSEVEQRSFELPARHIQFSILVPESDLPRAESFLCGLNRKRPNPWKVDHVLLDTDGLWREAQDLGMIDREGNAQRSQEEPQPHEHKRQRLDLESDDTKNSTTMRTFGKFSRFPLARLWQPDHMVETVLFPLLVKVGDNNQQSASSQALLEVWDLAAGAGRDVAFLAEELLAVEKPFRIIAVDHRYNDKETKIVNDFWNRRGIGEQTSSLKLNLSQWKTLEGAMASALTQNRVAAMFCVRFWKPDLVNAIAKSKSMPSGVLFALSHFCKPSLGAPWNFDHPSEKTVLERSQLHDLFETEWDILHDEIATDSDHGRTMVHFVARRK
mmetsp:Transcript_33432/g.78851  ORF Transcript_33432/g.78851 Transcript_33432/m.78851 type:complete len:395 (-) Transcript_33432:414-1598(-)